MSTEDRERVKAFLSGISDPEEREEWLAILREKRQHPPTPEKRREYEDRYHAKHRAETQERNTIDTMRKVVLRHPCIAFDLFNGVFNYPHSSGRPKGSGWSYFRDGDSYCRSCNKRTSAKPSPSCDSTRHSELYDKYRESRRVK